MQKIASILFKCGEDVGEGSYVAFANSKGGIDAFEKSGYIVKKLNPNEIDLTDIGIPGIIMATFELSAEKFNKNRWRMDSHVYISDYNVVVNVKDYMNFLDKKVNLGIIHQVGAEMGGAQASDVRRVFLDKILRLNAFDVRTGKSEYVRVFNLFDSLNLFHDFERDINDRLGIRPSDAEYAQEERDLIAITYSSGAEAREDAVPTVIQGDSNSEAYSEQSELNDMLNRLDNGQAYNENGQAYNENGQVYNGSYMPVGNVQSGATGFSGGRTYAGRVAGLDGIVKNGALNMSSFNRGGGYGGSYGNVYSGNGNLENSLNREMQTGNGVNNSEVNEDAVNSKAEPNTQVQNGQMYDGQQVQNGQMYNSQQVPNSQQVQNGQMYNGQVEQDMQVQNGQVEQGMQVQNGQMYNGQSVQNGQMHNGKIYNGQIHNEQPVQNGQVYNGRVYNGQQVQTRQPNYNEQQVQNGQPIKNTQQKYIIPPNAKLYIDDGTGVRELSNITPEQMKVISSYLSTGSFEVSDLDNTPRVENENNKQGINNNQINLNKSAMNKSMETQNIGNQVQSKGDVQNISDISNADSFKSTNNDTSLAETKKDSNDSSTNLKTTNVKVKKENIQNSEVEKELSELREQVANGEIMSDEAKELETIKAEIQAKVHSNQSNNELSNIKVPEQNNANSVIPEAESNLFENEEEQDYLKNSVWYSAMADLQETSLF